MSKIRVYDRAGFGLLAYLPPGYEGKGLKISVIDCDRLIVVHPEQRPLWVDRHTGETFPVELVKFSFELRGPSCSNGLSTEI